MPRCATFSASFSPNQGEAGDMQSLANSRAGQALFCGIVWPFGSTKPKKRWSSPCVLGHSQEQRTNCFCSSDKCQDSGPFFSGMNTNDSNLTPSENCCSWRLKRAMRRFTVVSFEEICVKLHEFINHQKGPSQVALHSFCVFAPKKSGFARISTRAMREKGKLSFCCSSTAANQSSAEATP